MKPSPSNRRWRATSTANEKQPRPLILALMLTGVLAIEAYPTVVQSAFAQTQALLSHSMTVAQNRLSASVEPENQSLWDLSPNTTVASPVTPTYRVLPNPLFNVKGQLPKTIPVVFETTPLNPERVQYYAEAAPVLPALVDTKVREMIAKQSGVALTDLKIVEARQQTWPDTCLGLAAAEEVCGQMLVRGWRVVVSDSRQTWVYRTDAQGRNIRLESQNHSFKVPSSLLETVFEDIHQQSGLSRSELTLEAVEEQLWPDGCLGLAEPGMFCTQSLVTGWRMMIGHENQRWVYRTNQTGSKFKLDQAASSVMPSLRVQFLKIPGDNFLSPWTETLIAHLPTPCQVSNFVNLSIGQSCSN
ncbi:hypothetical protein [Planktothrix mougeotii]|uniref:Uncharacterized protein n=1 Tax=Planktothrix mougeotii LEGE 06226 TaxID=1828728 RepID=A0ABR9UBU5_9CYAN|nr:hypothetical protein [Planktothrix mougeotii]MBE9143931.1 hypothetical protein [Planktothrix mougeotii LEGE 06226]